MTKSRITSLIVHALAWIGTIFWGSVLIASVLGNFSGHVVLVVIVAFVLGSAHALISITRNRGSSINVWLAVFVLVSDSLLGLFVDPKAFVLVGLAVVLFAAALLSYLEPDSDTIPE